MGLTQKEFAKLCKISQVSMNKIENGNQKPSDKTIERVCNVLEVPVSFLYFLSINSDDFIDDKKKELYKSYKPILKSIIDQILEK